MASYYSFLSLSYTLSNDNINRVSDTPQPFYECNIHCATHPVYYGTGEICEAPLSVGDVAFFKNGNLQDIFVKNQGAGNNGKIIIVATVPTAEKAF